MIILASASPRRQQLLSLVCDSFEIEPADIEETVDSKTELNKAPELLALKKAEYIQNKNHFDDIVIGCDTGVFLDGAMLGKPKSKENAKEMLLSLSGRKHCVITGCALLFRNKKITFSVSTEVEFFPLSESEIDKYIATEEPMDKAGGYGIQGKGALLVKRINGDYYNVVGLPIALLNKKLKELCENNT